MKKTFATLVFTLLINMMGFSQEGEITQKAVALRSSVWASNNINVCWENPENWNNAEREWVKDAVNNSISSASSLQFQGWGKCTSSSDGIRIQIADDGPHVKQLGRHLDGLRNGMVLNFTFNNWSSSCRFNKEFCIRAIGIHEFMHAVGFAHEQNRNDCNFPNCLGKEQGSDGDYYITPCDLNSIMNYCNPDWNNDGQLSDLDIQGLTVLYGAKTNLYGSIGYDAKNGSGNKSLLSGDFNGDGKSDIAQAFRGNSDKMAFVTYSSNGDGTWSETSYTAKNGHGFNKLLTGDFNGDGKSDIVQAFRGNNNRMAFATYLSNGNGTWSETNFTARNGHGFNELLSGDFNGDGKSDIVQAFRGNNDRMAFVTYLSNGNGTWLETNFTARNGYGYSKLLLGDLNADNQDDILQAFKGNGNQMSFISYLSKESGQWDEKNFDTK